MKPKQVWLIALTLALLAPKFSLSQCGLQSGPADSIVCGERTQLGVYADWESITSGTTVSLNAVYFPSASVGYACGNDGVFLKSTDGGKTFSSLTTPINNNLNALHFISEDTGIAVGTNGSILRTTNGGTSWSQPSSGTSQNLKTIFFVNSQTAYIGGELGTLLKTVNAGVTWNSSANGITSTPNDIIYSLHFPELQIGYAGVQGDIYKTTNGGASWSKITSYW
ncbi:MAG: WD40/YVTN/BNR-like repeat-containing protein, partial [Bacteroidia bacterium]